ncbi:MAG: acyltransferase family protein [Propionibacteriales bacterium]|nr:acyltransferase family protein [Propionibacteriales bacterium]
MFKYLPQLDGLRAVAVYLVLAYHAGSTFPTGSISGYHHWTGGGFIGVDLFFVLSGFLVSNVILSEIDAKGTFNLGNFYARRVRRLLPAAVLVVVATSVAFVVVSDVVRRIEMVSDARAALLYVANWHFLDQSTDYFSQDLKPSPFLHFWSLAIEEQFYVFFPIVIALLVRTGARLGRYLAVFVGVLFVASVASQLYWGAQETTHAYYGSDARLYQLLAGVLLAMLLRSSTRLFEGTRGTTLAVAGLAGLLFLGTGILDLSTTSRGLAATVASVAAIGALAVVPTSVPSRALGTSVPVYLGKISYGTYLWHWPIVLVLREVFTLGPVGVLVLAFALSTGLAALSYQVFEMPIRTNPVLARLRWTTVASGLTVSALVAAFLVAPVLESDRRPALAALDVVPTASTKIPGDGPVPAGIDFKALVKVTGKSKNCSATDLESCMVVKNDGPLVLVIGDSFANMLGPMFTELANEKGFSLAQNVVQGCPWPEDLSDTGQAPDDVAQCSVSRDQWYPTALAALKPALVVLVMRPRDDNTSIRSRSGDIPDQPRGTLIYRTMADTVSKIRASGAEVLMIQSVLDAAPALPLDCLAKSTRLSQCAVQYPETFPASDGYMEALAASVPGVTTTSINSVVCPNPPVCLPYLDGEPVFRDKHHITVSFAVANREKIWSLFARAGALRGAGLS